MNILIIGGLHGDETLGIDIVKLLRQKPIANVVGIFGNPSAIATNTRYADVDLNRVFPGKADGNLEENRAVQVMNIVNTGNFDVILDFHNTTAKDCNCSFVGEDCQDSLFGVSQFLGLNNVVVADYNCINKFVPTCLSVEVSYSSELCKAGYWYYFIAKLSVLSLENLKNDAVQKYKICGKLGTKPDFECINWQELLTDKTKKTIFVGEKSYTDKCCVLVERL